MHIFLALYSLRCHVASLPNSGKQLCNIPLRNSKPTLGKRSPLYYALSFTPLASSLNVFPAIPTRIHTFQLCGASESFFLHCWLDPVHSIAPFMFILFSMSSMFSICSPYVNSVQFCSFYPGFLHSSYTSDSLNL